MSDTVFSRGCPLSEEPALMNCFLSMTVPSEQEQDCTRKGFPPRGTWLGPTLWIEPSLQVQEVGGTPLLHLGTLYSRTTFSATSPALKVFPCGQVQTLGLATPPQGLPSLMDPREVGENTAPLVQVQWVGGWPWQGLSLLLTTLP